jgi:hypothetical protein
MAPDTLVEGSHLIGARNEHDSDPPDRLLQISLGERVGDRFTSLMSIWSGI